MINEIEDGLGLDDHEIAVRIYDLLRADGRIRYNLQDGMVFTRKIEDDEWNRILKAVIKEDGHEKM